MARLDKVKNITGLVEFFGKNKRLREHANLAVVSGNSDVKKSNDREEISEIEKMHQLMKKYNLKGQFRWISAQMNSKRNGELYRTIADLKGIFVQVFTILILLAYHDLLIFSILINYLYFLFVRSRLCMKHLA